jgi:hypothetical protein
MESQTRVASHRAFKPINRTPGAVIDGPWANRHRAGLDLSGLPPMTGAILVAASQLRFAGLSRMIPKMPVPDLIRDGNRFSEKIMRKEQC